MTPIPKSPVELVENWLPDYMKKLIDESEVGMLQFRLDRFTSDHFAEALTAFRDAAFQEGVQMCADAAREFVIHWDFERVDEMYDWILDIEPPKLEEK